MGVLRRGQHVAKGDLLWAAEDSKLQAQLPGLFEFLSLLRWDDGAARETGTVLLLAQDGVWKAWVNDKDAGRSAFLAAPTMAELLTLVDEKLTLDSIDWRASKPVRKK